MELEFKNPMIKKALDDFSNMNSDMMKLARNNKSNVSFEKMSFDIITGYLFIKRSPMVRHKVRNATGHP